MKLSTRVRYGMRAMVELAKNPKDGPLPLRKLAQKQQISMKYLEQLAASLKIAGLIESTRGAEGGYRLARNPDEISAWDIYSALDTTTTPTDCLNIECHREKICACRNLWGDLNNAIEDILKTYNLKKLAHSEKALLGSRAEEIEAGCGNPPKKRR
ncbi:MAG: RrF2 family transcriptional regulator [Planctomycetes bacterium]|nr:RrF2 family transcriptional regulator [Planctomycetota bacterium]